MAGRPKKVYRLNQRRTTVKLSPEQRHILVELGGNLQDGLDQLIGVYERYSAHMEQVLALAERAAGDEK